MKTIAQQLNVTEFPFIIKDKNENVIYLEYSFGWWLRAEYDSNGYQTYFENSKEYWVKREFDSNGIVVYVEDSTGLVYDRRPKPTLDWSRSLYDTVTRPKPCADKVVEIDGIKYKLTAV